MFYHQLHTKNISTDHIQLCYDALKIKLLEFIMTHNPPSLKIDDYRMFKVIDIVSYLGIIAHFLFIPFFLYLGFDFLAYFNIISVTTWLFARKFNNKGQLGYAITLLIVEVLIHAILATIIIGTDSGFQYYLFGLIPFSMFHQRLSKNGFIYLALGIGASYLISVFIANNIPHHPIDPFIMNIMLYSNIVIVMAGISITSINFREASLELEGNLKTSLTEREVLLKEVHHRVKNNMQIIISLLHLQGDKYDNEISESIINATESRINAMLLVHEKLFQNDSLAAVSVQEYLQALGDDLRFNHNSEIDVVFEIDCHNIAFNLDKLIPIGLVANESITNSFKYAQFPQEAKIYIDLSQTEGKHRLLIRDNGIKEPLAYERDGSIGSDLITGLSKSKLKGTSRIYYDAGTVVEIIF